MASGGVRILQKSPLRSGKTGIGSGAQNLMSARSKKSDVKLQIEKHRQRMEAGKKSKMSPRGQVNSAVSGLATGSISNRVGIQ